MINFILNIINFLTSKVLGNPVASAIVVSLIDDLKSEGNEMLGIAIANIKAVSVNGNMTNAERFNTVVQALKKQFPNVATSLINTVVESAHRAILNGKI